VCLHDVGCGRYVVVFPDPHDDPSSTAKSGVGFDIALYRTGQLGSPPVRVGLRSPTVGTAAVPEAAIHEDGNFCPCEDNIGTSPKVRNGASVDAKSETAPVKLRAKRKLRSGVSRPLRLHP
jgi:hypothetical protein